MENTLENKAKFFTQYWGQKVLTGESETIHTLNAGDIAFGIENNWLQLKPISLITDQEMQNIVLYHEKSAFDIGLGLNQIIFSYMQGYETNDFALEIENGYCLDYLRSKGYALSYMGLSVEKQIEYGWIKLK